MPGECLGRFSPGWPLITFSMVLQSGEKSYPCNAWRAESATGVETVIAVDGDGTFAGTWFLVQEPIPSNSRLEPVRVILQLPTMVTPRDVSLAHQFDVLPFVNAAYLDLAAFAHPALTWRAGAVGDRVRMCGGGAFPASSVTVLEAIAPDGRLMARRTDRSGHRRAAVYRYEAADAIPTRIEIFDTKAGRSRVVRTSVASAVSTSVWAAEPWRKSTSAAERVAAGDLVGTSTR